MTKKNLLFFLLFWVFLLGELKTGIASSHPQSECKCSILNEEKENTQSSPVYDNCNCHLLKKYNKTNENVTIQINLNSLLGNDGENTVTCFNTSAKFFVLNENDRKVCICDGSAHEFFSLYAVYNFGENVTSFDEISNSDIYKSLIKSGLNPVMIKTFKRKDNSGYITKFQMETPKGFSGTIQIINEEIKN